MTVTSSIHQELQNTESQEYLKAFHLCMQWPELAPRLPPPSQAAEPQTAGQPDPAESEADQLEAVNAQGMPRANGVALPSDEGAESVAAALPQQLAELLDVGERPPPFLEASQECRAKCYRVKLVNYHRAVWCRTFK